MDIRRFLFLFNNSVKEVQIEHSKTESGGHQS